MKIVKTIGAGIGIVLGFSFLGCGSIPIVAAGVPNIQEVAPAPLLAGANGATLTVVGANFDSGSKVLWNGTELSTTVVDSNTLSSPVESASLATPGVVDLAVKNTISGKVSPAVRVSVNSGNSSSSISVTTASLPDAAVNSPYSQTFAASGGTYPYTWSLGSGSKLPAGLSLDASTGTLAGTPTAAGTYSFGVVATDATRTHSKSTSYTLIVRPVTLSISSSAAASANVGSAYSQTLNATGGTPSYRWSVSSGSLPAGLSLSPTKGILSGTPTTAGVSNFIISVQDSSSPAQTASQPFSITVAGASVSALGISTSSIPSATSGQSYSAVLSATGGAAPYTWSLTSGSLPSGISLSSAGVLSGTSSTTGTFPFVATVSDTTSQTAPVSLTLIVSATPLKVTTTSLPSATTGAAYSQALQANGGTPGYKWSISSGSLPPGLTLNQTTGAISGTPTASSVSSFTAMAADSSNPTLTATTSLSISVASAALAIAAPSLPSLTVGTPYSQQLHATGGSSPYTWSLASGSLPPGLVLSSNGVISGSVSSASSSYTYPFVVAVRDSSTTVQTATANASIALVASASPLSITSAVLPSGTGGITYSAALQAAGGTPGYTWKISSGSLPAGLTLAATTGVISGTPSGSGTSTFTVAVSDNGNPVQSQSTATSIVVAAATQTAAPNGPGTFWFVRTDGGTRYSANVTTGQCDGKSDTAYPGTGTNQHCAFNDVRYMWMDGTYGNSAWVMAGGDTLVIRGCAALASQQNPDAPHCRIGWDKATGNDSENFWCAGVSAWWGCSMPPPPSGISSQHTRILGACAYGAYTCNPVVGYPYVNNNLTQLFGGFVADAVMYLNGSKYVDVEGLEITSHNGRCTRLGAPQWPAGCSSSVPVSDYAKYGIITDNTTSNVTLQDLYIHGMALVGIGGAIGGPFTVTRVSINFNAFAGWNFDGPGSPTDAPGSSITQSYVTMVGNGCLEEYPIVHTTFPAKACWDIGTGGFGDAWSGQATNLDSFTCDHCNISYNTKDGALGPHTLVHKLSLTNSIWVGNMGQNGKWGQDVNSTFLFQNNIIVGNCMRMSTQLPGAAQSFNLGTGLPGAYLTTFCRAAGSVFDYFADAGSTVNFNNNTIVTYQPTIFEPGCNSLNNCSSSPYNFTNNLILGYISADSPYNAVAPALYYRDDASVVINGSHNVEYGIRNGDTCGANANICSDPQLANEAPQTLLTLESLLDSLDFHPSSSSPAIGAGISITGLTTDYYGTARTTATVGAVMP